MASSTTYPLAKMEEGWKAEWRASGALQAEFPTVESYAAFMKAEARRRVNSRSGGGQPVAGSAGAHSRSGPLIAGADLPAFEAKCRRKWETSPVLQAEFPTCEAYVALMKHEATRAA